MLAKFLIFSYPFHHNKFLGDAKIVDETLETMISRLESSLYILSGPQAQSAINKIDEIVAAQKLGKDHPLVTRIAKFENDFNTRFDHVDLTTGFRLAA